MSTMTGGGGTYNPCKLCGFTVEQGARIFLFFDIVFSSTYTVSWFVWLHKHFLYVDIVQLIMIILIIGGLISRFIVATTLTLQWMPNKDGVIWYKVWAILACAGIVLCIVFGSLNMTINGLILSTPSVILCYGIWIIMAFTDVIKDVSPHLSLASVEPVVAAEIISQMVAAEIDIEEGLHHHHHDPEHHHPEHDPEHHHAEHEHIPERASEEHHHHRHPHHAGQKKNTA